MVVADFLKFKPEKNKLANPIPIDSRPADGIEPVKGRKLAPFQDARCRSKGAGRLSKLDDVDGAGRLSKPDDVDVSKSQGWEGYPARNAPFFLSGPERPIGGPPSIAQGQVYNREDVSAGPGIRPELLKSSEEIHREEVSVFSLSPGPPQLQNDRGKSKKTKKSLMDDILQLHLSKMVIGKGHIKWRIGRQRTVMEETTDLRGQISSGELIRDSHIINQNKLIIAKTNSPVCSETYVTQDDTLMTTLTVREVVYYSAQLQLPSSMSKSKKLERADLTIREMGLQDSINTRIGGWSTRGISGGQKRRVSICIEILTRPPLLFLDEPTSGLDSAASYHVMGRIIKLAQRDARTVIASIHQPSGEVFELFHNLCLLSSGRLVYFGATSTANEFFDLNGFPCPSFRNPSDHYLRTINNDFESVS
ncbi:hypothetical protein Ancab_003447 [Ancistrocladus abbreviatus]